jgi:hypothetical protein
MSARDIKRHTGSSFWELSAILSSFIAVGP